MLHINYSDDFRDLEKSPCRSKDAAQSKKKKKKIRIIEQAKTVLVGGLEDAGVNISFHL